MLNLDFKLVATNIEFKVNPTNLLAINYDIKLQLYFIIIYIDL